jgi:hypothetical protein
MCVVYNLHFAIYSKDKNNVTHLIPFIVWKVVYAKYKLILWNQTFSSIVSISSSIYLSPIPLALHTQTCIML